MRQGRWETSGGISHTGEEACILYARDSETETGRGHRPSSRNLQEVTPPYG